MSKVFGVPLGFQLASQWCRRARELTQKQAHDLAAKAAAAKAAVEEAQAEHGCRGELGTWIICGWIPWIPGFVLEMSI